MKLWIVTQTLIGQPGGVATHVRLLDQGLRFGGADTRVISPDSLPRGLIRIGVSLPLRVLNKVREGWGVEWAIKMHARWLRGLTHSAMSVHGRPDVFACQDVSSTLAVSSVREKHAPQASLLMTVHSHYTYEKVAQGWLKPASSGERRVLELERKAMLAADMLVAVSEEMRAHVLNLLGGSVKKVVVLPNAVDVERFSPVSGDRHKTRCRKQFGLPDNVPIILIAGKLHEAKGVPYAVAAAAIVRDRGEEFLLLIAGDGPCRGQVEAAIARHRLGQVARIIKPIPHDRMPTLLRACDLLIMPSIPTSRLQESFGLAAVEAMACGIPVIASRTGGLGDLVRDGQTGLVVPPANVEELADAITLLLVDREYRSALGAAARDYAVSHHDHVAHAHQFAALAEGLRVSPHESAVVRLAG